MKWPPRGRHPTPATATTRQRLRGAPQCAHGAHRAEADRGEDVETYPKYPGAPRGSPPWPQSRCAGSHRRHRRSRKLLLLLLRCPEQRWASRLTCCEHVKPRRLRPLWCRCSPCGCVPCASLARRCRRLSRRHQRHAAPRAPRCQSRAARGQVARRPWAPAAGVQSVERKGIRDKGEDAPCCGARPTAGSRGTASTSGRGRRARSGRPCGRSACCAPRLRARRPCRTRR